MLETHKNEWLRPPFWIYKATRLDGKFRIILTPHPRGSKTSSRVRSRDTFLLFTFCLAKSSKNYIVNLNTCKKKLHAQSKHTYLFAVACSVDFVLFVWIFFFTETELCFGNASKHCDVFNDTPSLPHNIIDLNKDWSWACWKRIRSNRDWNIYFSSDLENQWFLREIFAG